MELETDLNQDYKLMMEQHNLRFLNILMKMKELSNYYLIERIFFGNRN